MRIVCLVENTCGSPGCGAAHGLSFYIETGSRRILMDSGPSGLFLENASLLGIDLPKVDTAVLSHGHYDHGGGLPAFIQINKDADIFVHDGVFREYFSAHPGEEQRYIGIDSSLSGLSRVKTVGDFHEICEGIVLFGGMPHIYPVPAGNSDLMCRRDGQLVPDDFSHEMCLVIKEGSGYVLLSGCAHNGILNILHRFRELFGGDPRAVISGFHMMSKKGYSDEDISLIIETARELSHFPTQFYTCHCTGDGPFEIMELVMDGRLHRIHSGDEFLIN